MSYVTSDWHNGSVKGKSGVTLLIRLIFQTDGFLCGFMEALMEHRRGHKNTRGLCRRSRGGFSGTDGGIGRVLAAELRARLLHDTMEEFLTTDTHTQGTPSTTVGTLAHNWYLNVLQVIAEFEKKHINSGSYIYIFIYIFHHAANSAGTRPLRSD